VARPARTPEDGQQARSPSLAASGWRALRSASRAQKPHPAGTADATKAYAYALRFPPGSAEVPPGMRGLLGLMIRRIRLLPRHRVDIVAREETSGQADELAERRTLVLEALLHAEGIRTDRIRRRVRVGDLESPVEVHLLPWVRSQAKRPDEPPLDLEEVRLVGRVRRALRFRCDSERRALEQEADSIDWPRLCGHASLEEWARAGGRHPLYDDRPGPG